MDFSAIRAFRGMKLVMFDIDGTLTQSAHTDEVCFVHALRDVF